MEKRKGGVCGLNGGATGVQSVGDVLEVAVV
jgi:hypothetical protein